MTSTGPSPPDRDEAGSPNVVGAVAMAAACRALQRDRHGPAGASTRPS